MPRLRRSLLVAATAVAATSVPAIATATAGLDVRGTARILEDTGAAEVRQVGSFTSARLGKGRLDGRATLTGARSARMVLSLRGSEGFVRASGTVTVRITAARLTYRGTATVTSVDGAGRGLKGRRLQLRGSGDLVDNRIAVSLTG